MVFHDNQWSMVKSLGLNSKTANNTNHIRVVNSKINMQPSNKN